MLYFQLFFVFFKIGLFSFGGGLAMLPLLEKELIPRAWITTAEFYNLVAVSQATPGSISVSLATYVGEKMGGIVGSLFAISGIFLPSFILAFLLFRVLIKFKTHPLKISIFTGITAASITLLFYAAYSIGSKLIIQNSSINFKFLLLSALSFLFIRKFKTHPVLVLLGSGILSIFIH